MPIFRPGEINNAWKWLFWTFWTPFDSPGEYKIRHLDNKGRFIDAEDVEKATKEDKKRRPKKNEEDF